VLAAQQTMVLRCRVVDGRIDRVSVLPCWLDERLTPEPLPAGDSRVDRFLAYLRWTCQSPTLSRNAWEALYLRRPAEADGPARTVLRRESGEFVVALDPTAGAGVTR
jgi:hypothetical protein